MVSPKSSRRKKRMVLIVISVAVLVGVLGVAGWLFQSKQQEVKKNEQVAIKEAAEAEVAKLSFRGDKDLGVEYVVALKSNNPTAARNVYLDKAAATKDDAEKLSILGQYVLLAYKNKQYDQQLEACLAVVEVQRNYLTLFDVARAYGDLGSKAKQIEYLDQAIAAAETLPQDENSANIKALYISTRNDVKAGM